MISRLGTTAPLDHSSINVGPKINIKTVKVTAAQTVAAEMVRFNLTTLRSSSLAMSRVISGQMLAYNTLKAWIITLQAARVMENSTTALDPIT